MSLTDDLEKSIVLDIQKGTTSTIKFYQYDTARRLIIYFTYDNEVLDLTGKVPRIYMVKPDGEEIFSDLEVTDTIKGEAQIEFDENMLAVPGTMYCDVTIYEGGRTVSTSKFTITITKPLRNDRSITSTSEYESLTAALTAVDNCTIEVSKYNEYLENITTASPKGSYETLDELKSEYPLGDNNIYLTKLDDSYYVTIYEDGEWKQKFKFMTDELEDILSDLNTRFNNAINATTTDTEVIDARVDTTTNTTYTTLSERLKGIDNKINGIELHENKRIFKPMFGVNPYWGQADNYTGSHHSDTLETMKLECDQYEEMGLDSVTAVVHLAGNSETDELYLVEDLDAISSTIDYLATKNLNLKCVKAYKQKCEISNFTDFKTKYKAQLTILLEKFKDKGVEYFIPFNEMEEIYNDSTYKDWIIEIINYCKSYGFKVGISTTSWSLPLQNDFYEASDVIFPNLYPPIGLKGENTTEEDAYNAFQQADRIQKIIKCKELNPTKEIIINEIGMNDYWCALQAPSYFNWQESDKISTNGEAPAIMLKTIFEMLNKDYITEIWWWFDIYFEPTKKLTLKYLKGVE